MGLFGDFKKFALRGNLMDMAVGFTVGAAFTSVAKSLVSDIIMPPLGYVLGSSDFSDLFFVLNEKEPDKTYATLAQAQAAGLTTINYGLFINNIISFLLVAVAMFLIIRMVNQLDKSLEDAFGGDKPQPGDPDNKKCPYCLSTIPFRATRCAQCTAELPAVEGVPAS
ncbi:large conductance mechanosensitive channel protein MscL [Blastopirellula marina]|uniref:Large-conductance mechanosensitive channel n=1 Tax=Blastopirellula marina TaxID=124 RepID=A0A2S8F8A0_9BACT|nr:large conductance mechanosensitive channel protein MscL [Blastopirellula marina]PQO28383.1 large conductance mechanosensitive channel protein MscL [Blastopirellula marina]PTL41923.1 large conductance mechanosensitive channel protein MscL [Blastopirellula marina]